MSTPRKPTVYEVAKERYLKAVGERIDTAIKSGKPVQIDIAAPDFKTQVIELAKVCTYVKARKKRKPATKPHGLVE